jgi:ATP-dependent protease HslVU (ClpYQ) peptidase subunit
MTCIAAIIDKNGVGHIACDSLGSNYRSGNIYVNRKIFAVGDMLIGFCGSYRMGQILQYRLTLPVATVDQDLDGWMHVSFVDAVRDAFRDHGGMRIEHNEEEASGVFLVVVGGRIFTVQEDLSLLESKDNFEACGSGEDYARATMNAAINHGLTDPQRILTEAIEAATKYIPSVGGEIHMLSEEAFDEGESANEREDD